METMCSMVLRFITYFTALYFRYLVCLYVPRVFIYESYIYERLCDQNIV